MAEGLNFVKRESFGYGINGQQFIVPSGKPYTVVQDKSSGGTTAQILSGTNKCTTTDACYQPELRRHQELRVWAMESQLWVGHLRHRSDDEHRLGSAELRRDVRNRTRFLAAPCKIETVGQPHYYRSSHCAGSFLNLASFKSC